MSDVAALVDSEDTATDDVCIDPWGIAFQPAVALAVAELKVDPDLDRAVAYVHDRNLASSPLPLAEAFVLAKLEASGRQTRFQEIAYAGIATSDAVAIQEGELERVACWYPSSA